jgi:hypothetical protein
MSEGSFAIIRRLRAFRYTIAANVNATSAGTKKGEERVQNPNPKLYRAARTIMPAVRRPGPNWLARNQQIQNPK